MPSKAAHLRPSDAIALSKVNIPTDLHQRARAAVRLVERVTVRRYTFAQFARDYNRGRDIYPDSAPLEPGRR
jgi:hypothetical protein